MRTYVTGQISFQVKFFLSHRFILNFLFLPAGLGDKGKKESI